MTRKIILFLCLGGLLLTGPIRAQNLNRVVAAQDQLLGQYDQTDREYLQLQIDNRVSYFHQRRIGEAYVEKDFIRYQFDTNTGELVEQTTQWRDDLPFQVEPQVPRGMAEAIVEGEVLRSRLYYIAPGSIVYPLDPPPKNPCWVVRSLVNGRLLITIIDAMTADKLGYGTPPPYGGLSFYGPDWGDCPQDPISSWAKYAQNARDAFNAMGYSTSYGGNLYGTTVRGHIQSDSTAVMFELNHGGSTSFHNRCDDDIHWSEVESWISNYSPMAFTFLASCGGVCDTSDDHLSYEFRKGVNDDAVVVGYCGMSEPQCDSCWDVAYDWQVMLFMGLMSGSSVASSYNAANLLYPICAGANNCMRTVGDTAMALTPTLTRSIRASQTGHLNLTSRAWFVRSYVIAYPGNLIVDPWVTVRFMDDAWIESDDATQVWADGSSGRNRFVTEKSSTRGMKLYGQFRLRNNGYIRVYEE